MSDQVDYYAFKRVEYGPGDLKKADPWDFFISAYDDTDRVQIPFRDIPATRKEWIIHEEFGIPEEDWPKGAVPLHSQFDPPAILQYVRERMRDFNGARICVDSTGFIRPHLLVLLWALRDSGMKSFDVLYSDPIRYVGDENTKFTTGPVLRVEQVPGFAGLHRQSVTPNDLLVIGAGYDYEQIARACEQKSNSRKYLLTGLPSLQPHMYQESLLRIARAEESIGSLPPQRRLYSSANNPFGVAQVLRDLVDKERQGGWLLSRGNLYLCPVGPKPHVIGFGIFYLRELEKQAASIIYPFAESYSRLTARGLGRTWEYRVEF